MGNRAPAPKYPAGHVSGRTADSSAGFSLKVQGWWLTERQAGRSDVADSRFVSNLQLEAVPSIFKLQSLADEAAVSC